MESDSNDENTFYNFSYSVFFNTLRLKIFLFIRDCYSERLLFRETVIQRDCYSERLLFRETVIQRDCQS
jgi:hypothetical protein